MTELTVGGATLMLSGRPTTLQDQCPMCQGPSNPGRAAQLLPPSHNDSTCAGNSLSLHQLLLGHRGQNLGAATVVEINSVLIPQFALLFAELKPQYVQITGIEVPGASRVLVF